MRVLLLLFLFLLPSVSYSLSNLKKLPAIPKGVEVPGVGGIVPNVSIDGGAAAGVLDALGRDAANAACNGANDQIVKDSGAAADAARKAAADQAAADVKKAAAKAAAVPTAPDPAHPVKEVYCCGPYGAHTAACDYRQLVLMDGSCGVQIDPAYIDPASSPASAAALATELAAAAAQNIATLSKSDADQAMANYNSHVSAAGTLCTVAKNLNGSSNGATASKPTTSVDLSKAGTGSGSKDYAGSDGAVDLSKPSQNPDGSINPPSTNPDGSKVDLSKPDPCKVNDTRLSCQVDNYTKTQPCTAGDTRPQCQQTTPTDPTKCTSCCEASDPAYGGSPEQIDKLRGEQAKDRDLAEQRLSKISKFFNNKRVGFDNGVIDGDYQSKKMLCGNNYCSYSFCDIPANLKSEFCVMYQDQDKFFKKTTDYGTVASTPQTCPTFSLDFGLFGVQAINVHCVILDAIRSKIALTMTFLSLFIGFRIISSA